MSSKLDYLKKYAAADDKQHSKRKKVKVNKGLVVVDDDSLDVVRKSPKDLDDLIYSGREIEPVVVANVIETVHKNIGEWKNEDIYSSLDKSRKPSKRVDGDASPPRRNSQRHDSDDDASPPRRNSQRHDSDDDASPPRRNSKRHDSDDDASPPRRNSQRHDSDDDASPPRRNSKRHDSDDDASPPRRNSKRHDSDDDASPPRRNSKRHDSVDDASPPRRNSKRHDSNNNEIEDDVLSIASDESSANTSSAKRHRAGLHSAKEFGEVERELAEKRMQNMAKLVDGANASTVYRDKEGRIVDAELEYMKSEGLKQAKKARIEKIEKSMNKGAVQEQQRLEKKKLVEEMANQPFARSIDDVELESYRKDALRDGDPMAEYFQQLQYLEEEKKKQSTESSRSSKPKYNGPSAPSNRFGILPGYRWDGIVRGNAFESRVIDLMSKKKVMKEAEYEWSVSDM